MTEALRIFAFDHPQLARSLRAKLKERQTELVIQVATGKAEDWGDYKERVGVIKGYQQSIDLAEQVERDYSGE